VTFSSRVTACRICNGSISLIQNLGNFYSCGTFPSVGHDSPELGVLELTICTDCTLVQLSCNFDSTTLYTKSYGYRSSLNDSMVAHLNEIAQNSMKFFKDFEQVNHLDIGSNDATLINLIKSTHSNVSKVAPKRVTSTGVDPSGSGFKQFYTESELVIEPFNYNLAKELNTSFNLVTSIAMLYDLPDPTDFFNGIKFLLANNGVWISEQSYLFSMIKNNAFDTICHEHIEYYSVSDIFNLCDKVGLEMFDVEFDDTNGGSFRVYIQHIGAKWPISERLRAVLRSELLRDKRKELQSMFERINHIKNSTLDFLETSKDKGREIHGYGASTKGNTLLQMFKIDKELMPFIAEKNEDKFGKHTPGTKIPIVSEDFSKALNPYAYLVLPWHFKRSIILRESEFIKKTDTRFVFPLPNFEIF